MTGRVRRFLNLYSVKRGVLFVIIAVLALYRGGSAERD